MASDDYDPTSSDADGGEDRRSRSKAPTPEHKFFQVVPSKRARPPPQVPAQTTPW